jgi:hypothetical protein
MSRSYLAAGVAAAALVCAIAFVTPAGASARASTHVPPGFVGVVVDEPTWPDPYVNIAQQLGVMVSSGVESIRVAFDWASAQPYASWSDVPAAQQSEFVDVGGVPTDFSSFDQLVGEAAAHGLSVLPVILDAPSWDGQSYSDGTVAIPKTPGPYAAFVKALVQRYGPQGSFWADDPYGGKVPIEQWQIWNEPNIPAFWPAQPYYSRYVALLRAAHAAIKSADPSAKVVLAGLANYSWFELDHLYAHGAGKLFDVVAVHPYTKTPAGVITIIRYVRQAMDKHGNSRKPIVADEISWPSSLGQTDHDVGYDFATTEAGQARNIGKILPLLERYRIRLGIGGFDYYDWAGQERKNQLAFDFAGLFKFSGGSFTAKPAYDVFKRGVLALEGCQSKGPLATDCNK